MENANNLLFDNYSTSPMCTPHHTLVWAGDPNYEIPEEYPCSCGRMKVHYETCDKCGNRKWIWVEKDGGAR